MEVFSSMSKIPQVIREHEQDILKEWIKDMTSATRRSDLMNEQELQHQCSRFLQLLQQAVQGGEVTNIQSQPFSQVKDFLANLSASRARQGFTPSETATFIFSLKKSLTARLRRSIQDPDELFVEMQSVNDLVDKLGLFTAETFMKSREEIIARQQREMLELSTPVVKLWEGILALPLIGTLDSARTQVVMETLLQRVVETGSMVAIIDITGVPTVDTLVAQHLIKTVTAARLMGADCIISGIRPQIAQTIVHLGVRLGDITTKATLADAFIVALERTGSAIKKTAVPLPTSNTPIL
jgi:rsbT co-antagonist protein RsbR